MCPALLASLRRVGTLVTSSVFVALAPAMAGAQAEAPIFDRMLQGPLTGHLGKVAAVEVPSYCRFADAGGAKQFLIATENTPSDREVGLVLCNTSSSDSSSYWFVVFTFEESGFVKDDEKQSLDAAKILKTIQDGTEEANAERRDNGWDELVVTGWERPPYYDTLTNNLTWSTRLTVKGSTEESINHSVRLLGRRGVMHVDLVADPADMAVAVPAFDSLLVDYWYLSGNTYAEWKPGDKVASYGLTALIAGGTGAAAVKLGLFGKMWKAILGLLLALKKLAFAIVVAIAAFFKRKFGKKGPKVKAPPPPRPSARAPSGAYKPATPGSPLAPKPSSPVASAAPSVQAPPPSTGIQK